MTARSTTSTQSLGLELLSGADSFLNDLSPEDQAAISGGRRVRSRSRISLPSPPSRSDLFGGRPGRRQGGQPRGSFA